MNAATAQIQSVSFTSQLQILLHFGAFSITDDIAVSKAWHGVELTTIGSKVQRLSDSAIQSQYENELSLNLTRNPHKNCFGFVNMSGSTII